MPRTLLNSLTLTRRSAARGAGQQLSSGGPPTERVWDAGPSFTSMALSRASLTGHLRSARRERQADPHLRLRPRDGRPSSEREAMPRVRSRQGAAAAAPAPVVQLDARPAPYGERVKSCQAAAFRRNAIARRCIRRLMPDGSGRRWSQEIRRGPRILYALKCGGRAWREIWPKRQDIRV